jgi:caspase domain-containing protein
MVYQALLVANWEYEDPNKILGPLKGPRNDLALMKSVLTDSQFGLFSAETVKVRENLTTEKLRVEFLSFLQDAKPDDRLLLYFSGHGERLLGERLALCGVNTQHKLLDATSFDTTSLREWISQYNRSQSTIVILDCCYAGQMKGALVTEDMIVRSLGAGTIVLASGGNEPSRDATAEDMASPFTEALAAVLLDPEATGDAEGYLTVEEVYRLITQRDPPLIPKPHWNVSTQGSLALARRERAQVGRPELKGYKRLTQIEVVDLAFTRDAVVATWASGDPERLDLASLDDHRRSAVNRLSQLADAVIRIPEYGDDPAWQRAVHRAWGCIGTNLFETAIPPRLRDQIRSGFAGSHLLKLRLSFDPPDNPLEVYPWEYLEVGFGREPAARAWMLVERIARAQSIERRSREATPSAGVINSLRDGYAAAAGQVAEGLIKMNGLNVIMDRRSRSATWGGFVDSIDALPRFLLLFTPVKLDKGSRVGFFGPDPAQPDWRSGDELASALAGYGISFDAIVIVTFAAKPSQDAYRATMELARTMAWRGLGPVVFVCHAPGYERNFPVDGQDTFPVLLLDALTQSEPLPLEQAFWYAKNRVVEREGDERRLAFGAPGYYVSHAAEHRSSSPARGVSSGGKAMAPPITSRQNGPKP